MEPYSKAFRRDGLVTCDAGEGTQAVALRFDVSKSWVRCIKQQRREAGQTACNRCPTRQAWADWLRRCLVSKLRPGDMVVIDHLSSLKVAGVEEAIEAAGASVRYMPPCSPDLNPIELAFRKFKKLLRAGAERTTEKL
jgi:hypothetical protein